MQIADSRTFSVYFIVNGHEITEIEGLDTMKYNSFKNRHKHLSNNDAIQTILDHLSAKQFQLPEGIQYLYKSVDAVDFELIYKDEKNNYYSKLKILNSTKKYSFDFTINHHDNFNSREGKIWNIPVELYIKAKECDSMFYSLMLHDFKIHNHFPDVEMNTLHYSFDQVDYEVCNLDKGLFEIFHQEFF